MVAGGTVDAQSVGCLGFTTAAPDVQITWTGGGNFLRWFFVPDTPGDDTTLIINDPNGNWHCNDDWDPTSLNPMVDLASAPDGIYDIWVGVFPPGGTISGTLNLTEFTGLTPP